MQLTQPQCCYPACNFLCNLTHVDINNAMACIIGYHYTLDAASCNAAVACTNAFPTFYADEFPRVPACDTFVADAATYGDLAGTYYVLQGSTGTSCPDLGAGLTSADICGTNTCNGNGKCFYGECTCFEGYEGTKCQSAKKCTAGANGAACQNGGSPTGTTGNCACKCANGYSGTHCQTQLQAETATTQKAGTTTTPKTTVSYID